MTKARNISRILSAEQVTGDINISGIVTAASYSGDGSGLTGVAATSDVRTSSLVVSGVSTFSGTANFSGNVSVAGTLTYEDVTNIDSIGLITARSGIEVTGGGINISSGVITATSFNDANGNIKGVGIATAGGTVGTGVTLLDFRNSGVSTVTVSSGIATLQITGGGGAAGFNGVNFIMG